MRYACAACIAAEKSKPPFDVSALGPPGAVPSRLGLSKSILPYYFVITWPEKAVSKKRNIPPTLGGIGPFLRMALNQADVAGLPLGCEA
jgi:hypothetical protein